MCVYDDGKYLIPLSKVLLAKVNDAGRMVVVFDASDPSQNVITVEVVDQFRRLFHEFYGPPTLPRPYKGGK